MVKAITRFIDVSISKETPRVASAEFGTLLCITNSAKVTTGQRIQAFTGYTAVSTFFGSASEEAKYANAFYYQDPDQVNQPEDLIFGRYVDAAIAAVIECGNAPLTTIATWAAISDGEFSVDIDGAAVELTALDFGSVTSMDDVAAVIDTALSTDGDCVWNQVNRFVINSGTTGAASTIDVLEAIAIPSGTAIHGTGFLDGAVEKSVTVPGGSILSQGQIAETVATAIGAIEEVNNTWASAGAILALRDSSDTEDIADAIESREKIFLIATNDANTVVQGDTSTFAYYLKNLNYGRSAVIYNDNSTLYPDAAWLGQQLPKDVGSTNWAFQTLPGIPEGAAVSIPAVSLTQAQINAAQDKNCNVYTSTLGSSFTHLGVMGGGRNADKDGEYIDIVRNIDFLTARVEEQLLSLLVEKEIIPMTNGGISTVDNRLKSVLDTYGVKQGILVEGSVVTSFPKRSEISVTDRDNRLLPDGTFTAELQGGINKIVLRGKVYI